MNNEFMLVQTIIILLLPQLRSRLRLAEISTVEVRADSDLENDLRLEFRNSNARSYENKTRPNQPNQFTPHTSAPQ